MQSSNESQRLKGILKNSGNTSKANRNNCQSKSRLNYVSDSNGSANPIDFFSQKYKEITTSTNAIKMQADQWYDSDDSYEETIEEKEKRKRFERLRRNYYSEYEYIKEARRLMEEETDDELENGPFNN